MSYLRRLLYRPLIQIAITCGIAVLVILTAIAPLQAQAAPTNAEVYRFQIGAIDALVVNDGTLTLPPLPTYAPTAPPAAVEQALRDRFLPPDQLTLYFNALYLDTGRHKVLIDTGAGQELGSSLGRVAANLQAAGIAPASIDTVILTQPILTTSAASSKPMER